MAEVETVKDKQLGDLYPERGYWANVKGVEKLDQFAGNSRVDLAGKSQDSPASTNF